MIKAQYKWLMAMIMAVLMLSGCKDKIEAVVDQDIFPGEILEITSEETQILETSGGGYEQIVQTANIELLDGPFEGQVIQVINVLDQTMAYDIVLYEGKEAYFMMNYNEDGTIESGTIYKYRRDKYIYWMIAFFFILMVVIGGWEGFRTLITLGLTLVGVYYMLIGIARGGNPILLSVVVCIVVTVVTMFLIAGFNRKATSAIIGTLGGVFISGIVALVISNQAVLTGLGTQEAQMLMFTHGHLEFNFSDILFASILLGTLGAVMDVCISISSSINEIMVANPFMVTKDLFHAGMNIGKDIMGTMANTLILAYVGSSIFLMLVFFMNGIPYFDIINMDAIATEIVRAIGGTIGLVLCIPLTAYVAAVLEKQGSTAEK